ncbi:MAG TPA: class I SAM-dependent methyltransferase [Ignavibacteriaceae bacterium]|nr:class I SAM-dependent methyltransferase [Ignavibacteriaceae bacterium]
METCKLCDSGKQKKFLCKVSLTYKTEYNLIECTGCGGIYFDPMPTAEDLGKFYSGEYFNFNRWHDEAKGKLYSRKLKKLASSGRFLDVGCALGFFIDGIRKNSDWDVYGLEFGVDAVEFANKQLGLNVKQGEIIDAGYPDKFFDYVHVNNVLEHVRDPKTMLMECRRILKDNGNFFLSVPNGANDCRNLIDFYNEEKLPARSPSGHIFFFPSATLLKLFNEVGFTVVSKKTGSIKRGMRNVGWLPKKKSWKGEFYPRTEETVAVNKKITLPEKPDYPEIYYKYRYLQSHFHDLPGLYKFGLDFLFLLRPSV